MRSTPAGVLARKWTPTRTSATGSPHAGHSRLNVQHRVAALASWPAGGEGVGDLRYPTPLRPNRLGNGGSAIEAEGGRPVSLTAGVRGHPSGPVALVIMGYLGLLTPRGMTSALTAGTNAYVPGPGAARARWWTVRRASYQVSPTGAPWRISSTRSSASLGRSGRARPCRLGRWGPLPSRRCECSPFGRRRRSASCDVH